MDDKLQFPGLSQHLDDAGGKPSGHGTDRHQDARRHQNPGPALDGIQQIGAQIQQILAGMPEVRSVFAERVSQGFYVNVDVNRAEAARYGLTVADVQQAVTSGIGGANVAQNVEGRERYPDERALPARLSRQSRGLRRVLIGTPTGAQIPIGRGGEGLFLRGPAMIRDEDGAAHRLRLHRPEHEATMADSSTSAEQLLQRASCAAAGYTYSGPGEYEFQLRAQATAEDHSADRVLCDLSCCCT